MTCGTSTTVHHSRHTTSAVAQDGLDHEAGDRQLVQTVSGTPPFARVDLPDKGSDSVPRSLPISLKALQVRSDWFIECPAVTEHPIDFSYSVLRRCGASPNPSRCRTASAWGAMQSDPTIPSTTPPLSPPRAPPFCVDNTSSHDVPSFPRTPEHPHPVQRRTTRHRTTRETVAWMLATILVHA